MNFDHLKHLFQTDAQRKQEQQQHDLGVSLDNIGAGVAATAPAIAPLVINPRIAKPLFDLPGEQLNSDPVKRLIATSGLDMGTLAERSAEGMPPNAFYMPKPSWLPRKMFNISPEEVKSFRPHGMMMPLNMRQGGIPLEIAAHEIGHGMAHHQGPWLGKMLARSRGPAGLMGAGVGAIDLMRGTSGDKTPEERDRLLNQSSLGFGLGMAPVLGNEAQASMNAMKLLKKLPPGLAEGVLSRAPRTLGRAGSTYGLAALASVLAPQAAKWWYHRHGQ